jgi:hypothetical protein
VEDELKDARHNLRGKLNALKLCVTALHILRDRQEKLEFLAMIEQSADSTHRALDEMEAANDRAGITQA